MKKFSPKGNGNREVVSRNQKFRMKKKIGELVDNLFFYYLIRYYHFLLCTLGGYNSYV